MATCIIGVNNERTDPLLQGYLPGNGYRAYNPAVMRFNCPDSWSPFGAGGVNPYTYCMCDPVNQTDPSGHASWHSWAGMVAGIAGILLIPFTFGQSSIAAALAIISSGMGIASVLLENKYKTLSMAFGWASLIAGLPELAFGAVKAFHGAAAALSSLEKFVSKIQRVNGSVGIPLSGEFRNARFLGINPMANMSKWNMTYEDTVPTGTRLNIIMGSVRQNKTIRPANAVWWNDDWVRMIYSPRELKNAANMEGDYSVYRLIIPGSADPMKHSRNLSGSIVRMFQRIPVIGYTNPPMAYGPVANALNHQYGLLNKLNLRGIVAQPEAAQGVLTELSARYAATSNALTFAGGDVSVYPNNTLIEYPDILEW